MKSIILTTKIIEGRTITAITIDGETITTTSNYESVGASALMDALKKVGYTFSKATTVDERGTTYYGKDKDAHFFDEDNRESFKKINEAIKNSVNCGVKKVRGINTDGIKRGFKKLMSVRIRFDDNSNKSESDVVKRD